MGKYNPRLNNKILRVKKYHKTLFGRKANAVFDAKPKEEGHLPMCFFLQNIE
jgi:hypothetical protein